MIKITRRTFLKGSVAVGVAGALSGTVLNTLRPSKAHAEESGTVGYTPTMCAGCTSWCSVEVKTQLEAGIKRAIDVRGNRYSKRGDATNGDFNITCPRARIALQEAYDADRVKVPMRRTNNTKGRGVDPGFIPISWDDAMTEIADKMIAMRNADMGHRYTYFRGRYSYNRDTMYSAVKSIYGSPNGVSHSSICAEAENFARSCIVGRWGYDDYDIDNCRYLMLWGVDPVSSNRLVSGTIKKLGERMNAGMTVVSIDPRLHATAAKAHKWLPVKPGTDGALALAMAHHILVSGLWNKTFVGLDDTVFTAGVDAVVGGVLEKGTKGLVEWWNTELKDRTPSWAAAKTGISSATIRAVAEGFAGGTDDDDKAKAISWLGPGIGMSPCSEYSGWAVLALNALVGSMDHLGGEIQAEPSVNFYSSNAPSQSAYKDAKATAQGTYQKMIKYVTSGTDLYMPAMEYDKAAKKFGVGKISPTNRAADSINDSSPYEIKFTIGNMNNFVFSCAGAKRWEDALSGDMTGWSATADPDTAPPFNVHLTTHASEFSMFSDIVLPAKHLGLEAKASTHQRSGMYKIQGLYNRVIEAVWPEAMHGETEVPWLLAQAFDAQGFSNLLDYLRTEYPAAFGDSPLSAYADASEFEDYAHKYHATKGTASNRNAQWTEINGSTMTIPGTGADEVGNGIAQSTYALTYFDSNGRGQAWQKAVAGTGGFDTATNKAELCNDDVSKMLLAGLSAHASAHSTTIAGVMTACNYDMTASGIGTHGEKYAAMPHWEEPYIADGGAPGTYKYTFIDHKSRLNREGRSANAPWYHEFKSCDAGDAKWRDVVKINPLDASALGVKDGDTVKITSPANPTDGIICKVAVWAGVRSGTVAKSYGQGHWAYGRYASKNFGTTPNGGNNNEVLPAEWERMSGSTARHAVTKVKIEKVV